MTGMAFPAKKEEMEYVVIVCVVIRGFCSAHIYTGKGRDRRGEFQSGYGDQNAGRCDTGLGDRVFVGDPERHIGNQQKELAFSDSVRSGYGSVVDLLLQGDTDRGSFQSRSDRQAECGDHAGAGVCVSA